MQYGFYATNGSENRKGNSTVSNLEKSDGTDRNGHGNASETPKTWDLRAMLRDRGLIGPHRPERIDNLNREIEDKVLKIKDLGRKDQAKLEIGPRQIGEAATRGQNGKYSQAPLKDIIECTVTIEKKVEKIIKENALIGYKKFALSMNDVKKRDKYKETRKNAEKELTKLLEDVKINLDKAENYPIGLERILENSYDNDKLIERSNTIFGVKQYVADLKDRAKFHNIGTFINLDNDIEKSVEEITNEQYAETVPKSFPESIKKLIIRKRLLLGEHKAEPLNEQDLKLLQAATFYKKMINPLVIRGTKICSPNIENLCNKLASKEGANIVIYCGITKTQSPLKTGSTNSIIDMANIEMLRHYSLIARTAKKLELNLRFTIVDETDGVPNDKILGHVDKEKAENIEIAREIIRDFGAKGLVTCRTLKESIIQPLGEKFESLYNQKQNEIFSSIQKAVNSNPDNPLAIRLGIFIDAIPDQGLRELGITSDVAIEDIRAKTESRKLSELPKELVDYALRVATDFQALMELRSEAQKIVQSKNNQDKYPEYSENRIHAGITRSAERLSLLPSHKKFNNQTIIPMHGLAIYTESSTGTKYEGVAKYQHLMELQKSGKNIEIVYLDKKPIFAVQRPSDKAESSEQAK